jgi:hypothetical protein
MLPRRRTEVEFSSDRREANEAARAKRQFTRDRLFAVSNLTLFLSLKTLKREARLKLEPPVVGGF